MNQRIANLAQTYEASNVYRGFLSITYIYLLIKDLRRIQETLLGFVSEVFP